MRWLDNWWFRVRALVTSRNMERELDDEIAFHLAMETEKLMDQGMSPEDARVEARRRFGSEVRERERAREAWGVGLVQDLGADAVHTFRQFRRHPAFAAVSILTLALGIGATVALFSVVHGLMLRPLPFPADKQLVVFWSEFNWRGVEFDFAKERVTAYEHIAAFSTDAVPLQADAGTSLLMNTVGSAELFDVLGVRPLLGRTFQPGEDRPGAEPVVILSHSLWQQEMGSDPSVLGQRLLLGGVPTTIIGVMPPGFYFPSPNYRAWRPLVLDPASNDYRGNASLSLIARVRAGVTDGALQGDLQALASALGEEFDYPAAWDKSKDANLIPMRAYLFGNVRPAVLLLLGAVGLLLLMATANAAALILARTTDRTGEMAVRTALGADGSRIARQVLTESLVLAAVAGVGGALLARVLFQTLVAMLPLQDGFGEAISLTWIAFAVGIALATIVGIAVAVVPMRHLLRGNLEDLRGERTEGGLTRRTGRAQAALVAAEVLLAVTLVTGAGLLIRSVAQLRALDLGIGPSGVVTVDLMAADEAMDDVAKRQFFQEAVRRVTALPGVHSAGLVVRLPIRDGGWQGPVTVESRPDLTGAARPNSFWRMVTPGYFTAIGIELRQGRGFDERDREGTLLVTVVSETFARRMWPGEDPIGKRIATGISLGHEWLTVVGVVEDARLVSVTDDHPPVMYVPMAQAAFFGDGQVLVVRREQAATDLIPQIRALVRDIDPRVAVSRASSMEEVVAGAMAEPLRLRFFLMLFAALGLILGTVGVYGVVSYAVTRRRSEFGIRMALGATSSNVLTVVVRRGMVPVAVGVAGGIAASLAMSRLLAGFLYDVAPTDPTSLVGAATTLLLTGIGAAVIPAWRAGRVSPVEVLRVE